MTDEQNTPGFMESTFRSMAPATQGLRDGFGNLVESATRGNLNISSQAAKDALPYVAAGTIGLGAVLLNKPLAKAGKWLFDKARWLVTGGGTKEKEGFLEKIPVLGYVFKGLGWVLDKAGDFSGYIFGAVAALFAFKLFANRGVELPDTASTGLGAQGRPPIVAQARVDTPAGPVVQPVPVRPAVQPAPPTVAPPAGVDTSSIGPIWDAANRAIESGQRRMAQALQPWLNYRAQIYEDRMTFIDGLALYSGVGDYPGLTQPERDRIIARSGTPGVSGINNNAKTILTQALTSTGLTAAEANQMLPGAPPLPTRPFVADIPVNLQNFARDFDALYPGVVRITRNRQPAVVAWRDCASLTEKAEYIHAAITHATRRYNQTWDVALPDSEITSSLVRESGWTPPFHRGVSNTAGNISQLLPRDGTIVPHHLSTRGRTIRGTPRMFVDTSESFESVPGLFSLDTRVIAMTPKMSGAVHGSTTLNIPVATEFQALSSWNNDTGVTTSSLPSWEDGGLGSRATRRTGAGNIPFHTLDINTYSVGRGLRDLYESYTRDVVPGLAAHEQYLEAIMTESRNNFMPYQRQITAATQRLDLFRETKVALIGKLAEQAQPGASSYVITAVDMRNHNPAAGGTAPRMELDVTFLENNVIKINKVRINGGSWQSVSTPGNDITIDIKTAATRQAGMAAMMTRIDYLRANPTVAFNTSPTMPEQVRTEMASLMPDMGLPANDMVTHMSDVGAGQGPVSPSTMLPFARPATLSSPHLYV